MTTFSNVCAAVLSSVLGLTIGVVLLVIGLLKNIEDLVILGGLFLGLLFVLVVLISIKVKKEKDYAPVNR
jgi:membrane protein DedA with SNARE-associated domain